MKPSQARLRPEAGFPPSLASPDSTTLLPSPMYTDQAREIFPGLSFPEPQPAEIVGGDVRADR